MANSQPVILVHGLLGFGPKELGPLNYWGSAFKVHSKLKRFEASVGPLSSAHDRACELAAQLAGAVVDYGEDHALKAGHKRFGYDFRGKGFVESWSAQNPVHLVGHSLGSPTVRCLHHLLATDYWDWGSNEHWIKSISTISGVSNGSTLVYFFGIDEQSGLINPDSGIDPALRMIEVFTAASGGILDAIYDFDLDHWGFERQVGELLTEYLERVGQSDFFWGEDNAAYTLSLQGALRDNAVWQTYPETYYFSYITSQTDRGWFTGRHYPSPLMNPAMLALATYIGHKEFRQPPVPVDQFDAQDWWENDGAVSTYSQIQPHISGHHLPGREFDEDETLGRFEPGQWHQCRLAGMDHLDVCMAPQLTQIGRQRRFYRHLFARLADL